jgi:outer membrane protein OmpA-like peptidoglycan-associated protein
MRLISALAFMFFIFFSVEPSAAQSDCEPGLSKKAQKLLEKGTDRKNDINKRQQFLQQALGEDENCLECLFYLGINSYKLATVQQRTYAASQRYFEKLYAACPNYHADVMYHLGLFAYINKEYEVCYAYFQALYQFFKTEEEDSKFPKDWDKKFADVKEVMPEVEFFATFYQNPVPFTPKKVEEVSTSADEYLPMLSPDNKMLFYTREKKIQEFNDPYPRKVELFTMSRKTGKGVSYNQGEALPNPFNIGFNYGGMTLSADNREMYITVCKPIPGREDKNCDIYVSYFTEQKNESGETEYKWSELENLGPNINTPLGWESQPSLSGDGMTLFYAAARENTKGIDIFYSDRQTDGSWGKAKPLSDVINTKGNEKAPFIHSDSRTLYFASNGHYGAGGYDLFYSRQDETGVWSTPKNLGHPINSEVDEHGLIVSANGKYAFYSSNRFSKDKRTLDIISFELPENAKPDEVVLLEGLLTDENNNPIEDATIEISSTEGGKPLNIQVKCDKAGRYSTMVAVPKNREMVMQVKKEGFAFDAKVVKIPKVEPDADLVPPSQIDERKIEKVTKGKAFALKDINYETASANIDKKSLPVLDAFARYLNENPDISVEIRGHTDNVGNAAANLALSSERAFNVLNYLQSKGVEGKRLKFKGFGDTKPIATNATPEGRAQNRRTEFLVL